MLCHTQADGNLSYSYTGILTVDNNNDLTETKVRLSQIFIAELLQTPVVRIQYFPNKFEFLHK